MIDTQVKKDEVKPRAAQTPEAVKAAAAAKGASAKVAPAVTK